MEAPSPPGLSKEPHGIPLQNDPAKVREAEGLPPGWCLHPRWVAKALGVIWEVGEQRAAVARTWGEALAEQRKQLGEAGCGTDTQTSPAWLVAMWLSDFICMHLEQYPCYCCLGSRLCCFAIPCTVAHQAPPFMEFSRPEYWSGLPFPSPGDLPNPGIEPTSPALPGRFFTTEPPGKPRMLASTLQELQVVTEVFTGLRV